MTYQEKLLSAFKERRIDDFQKLLECGDVDIDYFYGEPDNGTLLDLANRSPKNERYIFELIRNGAKVWRHDEETSKLVIHEIFNSSDEYLLCSVWDGVYSSFRSGNDNANNITKVAVEKNDIEAITLLARSYSMVHDRFNDGRPEGQHLILLLGSIDAVRLFIKYFDVDKEFQKDSQGRVFSCREIILQKYPELEAELPIRSTSELQEILFSYLENGVPELFVERIADIGTKILNEGKQKKSMFTYLHVACEHNYINVVDALLKKNVHLNELSLHFYKFAQHVTPIMVAAFKGHNEIFEKLLIIPEVELQNVGGSGSVLHLMLHGMEFMRKQNYPIDGHRMIQELLLQLGKFGDIDELLVAHCRLDIEYTDKSNKTALHCALKFNNEFVVKSLLRAGAKLDPRDRSTLTPFSATILEDYFDECISILQKYPELEAELPIKLSSCQLEELLFLYLKKGVPELFVRRIAEISADLLNVGLQKNTKLTYLHVACERNYIDVVDALLKKNVNLNMLVPYCNKFEQNVTPIMLAAFKGHYEVFEKLFIIPEVELQNAVGSGSVLHSVLHGMQLMQNRNCSTYGHRMILESLLQEPLPAAIGTRLNIEHKDESNRTALHYALKFNNEFAAYKLLRAGAKLYVKDRSVLTWISARIIKSYFDDCIRSERDSSQVLDADDNLIIFQYKIFTQLDLCSIATKPKNNEPITELRKLYVHPLTKSLLYLKWRLVRKYYCINLVFYILFCLALSTYIFQIQQCVTSSTNFNDSGSTDTAINRDVYSILCDVSLWMWPITLSLYIVLILRELCQFAVSFRRYIGIPENWLIVMMTVVIGLLFADDTCTHLAAIVILTSWIELIFLLGMQPSLSIYIEMFKTAMTSNFVKFLLLYSILVASFAYSFFILFRNKTSGQTSSQNQNNVNTSENLVNWWQDLRMSFFKSIIMMTGEFDAANLPLDSNFGYGHVFFMLFVVLVTMVLYNLLNGLAVSDTPAIMENAEILATISRAKFIAQIDRLAVSNPFRNALKCTTTEQLERGYLFLRNKLFGDVILIGETGRVYVYPTKSNRIEIYGRNFGKMPSTIVKHAEEILEKRKPLKLADNENQNSLSDVTKKKPSERQFVSELVHQFSEQMSDFKLEIEAKITARDEKLLQNVDQRFDKMMNKLLNEQISDLKLEIDAKTAARDEKSLRNVNKRFDKINELLESVLREVNLLKNKD